MRPHDTLRKPRPRWPLAALALLLVLGLAAPSARAQHMDGGALVDEYIARTDELLDWAADLVSETESGTARSVLRQADDLNRRARDMNGMGQSRQAGNMARRARAAVWHAVKLAREAMGLQERLRVRAERFREVHRHLTERARELGNERAIELLNKAEDQAHRAREQHLQGDLRMAWQMFERAEDMTAMAARLLASSASPAQLEHELERVQARLDDAHARLGADADRVQRRQLGEAEEALARARRHLAEGEPGRALQMVGLARRLTDRVLAGSGAPVPDDAVPRQLERFDERMARVGPRVREAGVEQALQLLNRAREHRDRADAAWRRDATEEALRQIRAAHDLLEQAERTVR